MILRLLLFTLAASLAGCALQPNHVTVYAERAESVTGRKTTESKKMGVSATYDLKPHE